MPIPIILSELVKLTSPIGISRLTKIRLPRLTSHLKGVVTPRIPSIKKYVSAYRRINYTRLRTVGANFRDANRFKGGTLLKINDRMDRYKQFSNFISIKKDVDEDVIINSMARSKRSIEDFERDSL